MKRLTFSNALTAVGILILFGLAASDVLADDVRPEIRWEPPTSFVDGTPLDPLTDLSEYRLYCDPSVGTQTIVQIAPPYEWQAPAGLFLPGVYTCYMTAVDQQGNESDPSNTKQFNVNPNRPSPIIIFEIQ